MAIQNLSDDRILEADVQFGSFMFGGERLKPGEGVLPARGISKYYPVPYPVPLAAKVLWRTSDGRYHEKEVEVKKHVPADFRGYIVFQIRQEMVTVSLEE